MAEGKGVIRSHAQLSKGTTTQLQASLEELGWVKVEDQAMSDLSWYH